MKSSDKRRIRQMAEMQNLLKVQEAEETKSRLARSKISKMMVWFEDGTNAKVSLVDTDWYHKDEYKGRFKTLEHKGDHKRKDDRYTQQAKQRLLHDLGELLRHWNEIISK
jgi:hypothetical protein